MVNGMEEKELMVKVKQSTLAKLYILCYVDDMDKNQKLEQLIERYFDEYKNEKFTKEN